MHSIINLHSYFMLNIALVMGYVITRIILNLPLFKHKFLQMQRLKFARYSFLTAIAAFYIGPVIAAFLPAADNSSYRLAPIVKMV